MLRHALILSSHREYAQTMRQGLITLAGDGAKIDIETDALRAMQLAPQTYDLIMLDAKIDAMDGLQWLQVIKVQAPAARFVVVSESGDETARAMAYQNGADFFLERPRGPQTYSVALEAIRGLFKSGVAAAAAPEDTGNRPVNLADIVQMRCLSGDSVLLLVTSSQHTGDIFIYRGEVFHAQYPGKGGEGAFLDMIRWDQGRVQIKSIKLMHAPPRTIEIPYRLLLGPLEAGELEEPDFEQEGGELIVVSTETPSDEAASSVVLEAPPLAEAPPSVFPVPDELAESDTPLPQVNSHWRVNLTGELIEGSRVAEPDRCAFITTFIYRKMADVAVALEVDYFEQLTLFGPHLQQVLVADNLGIRHAVFDSSWTKEEQRNQYLKWCREQSI